MRPIERIVGRVASSVRLKLLAMALVPVAVVVPLALFGLTSWSASFAYDQLYIKVNTDLAVAHDTFRAEADSLSREAGGVFHQIADDLLEILLLAGKDQRHRPGRWHFDLKLRIELADDASEPFEHG